MRVIYLDVGEGGKIEGWGSSPISANSIKFAIEGYHDFFFQPFSYRLDESGKLVKNDLFVLELAKTEKMRELSTSCEQVILGRFSVELDGVTYQFSNDMEAQMNFDKMDNAFEKGHVTDLLWTAYDTEGEVVRVLLDPFRFELVYIHHLTHIQSNISKFRDTLMPLVGSAKTVVEIGSIHWNMEIPPTEST